MRIGIFTNSYKPVYDSGVVNVVDNLRYGLTKLKQEVYIFAPKFPNYRDEEANVYRYNSVNLPLKVKYPIAIPYSFKISKMIKQSKFDIIHTHHPFNLGRKGAYFARKCNIPLVFTNHTKYEDYSHYIPFNQKFTKKIIRYLHKKYLNLCNCIIAPTANIKEFLLNIGIKSRIEVIPNAINLELLRSNKPHNIRKLYRLENKKILLFIGRLAKEKNIPFIIKAFKILSKKRKNAVLLIGGAGYEEKNLKNLVHDLKIQNKVLMIGNIPHSEVSDYYSAADLFVTASTTEVHPLTLLESLAFGVPTIALEKSNLRDIIENGKNGFLTEASLESFSRQITDTLNDESMLRMLSKNAELSSKNYDIKSISRKLLSLYQSLI